MLYSGEVPEFVQENVVAGLRACSAGEVVDGVFVDVQGSLEGSVIVGQRLHYGVGLVSGDLCHLRVVDPVGVDCFAGDGVRVARDVDGHAGDVFEVLRGVTQVGDDSVLGTAFGY